MHGRSEKKGRGGIAWTNVPGVAWSARDLAFLLLVLAAALAHFFLYDFPFEDSYITFRYARNLAEGNGLVFNPGEVVEGFTSFGWTVLLSGVHALGLDMPAAARVLSAFFGLLLVVATACLARRVAWQAGAFAAAASAPPLRSGQPAPEARPLQHCETNAVAPGRNARGWWWVLAPLLLTAHGTLAYYSMTGMETTLFALLVALAVLCVAASAQRSQGDQRSPAAPQEAGAERVGQTACSLKMTGVSNEAGGEVRGAVADAMARVGGEARCAAACGVLLALAALVRPEGVGYFGLVFLALASHRESRRMVLPLAAAFLVIFVPYFAWRWWHFGYPLPNTFYAKATPAVIKLEMGFKHFEQLMTLHALWLVPVVLAFAWKRRGWCDRWVRLAMFLFFGAAANVILVGGDTFFYYRFFLPVLPIASVALATWPRAGSRIALALALPLAVLTFCASFLERTTLTGSAGKSNYALVHDIARLNEDYFVAGRTLRERFPAGTLVALNAAGIVAYESGLPVIDMLGLNDEHIAHARVSGPPGAVGHEKHDAAFVLSREPDVIIPGLPVLSPEKITPATVGPWFARWFDFLPGDRSLFQHPDLPAHYRVANLPTPTSHFLVVFLRL